MHRRGVRKSWAIEAEIIEQTGPQLRGDALHGANRLFHLFGHHLGALEDFGARQRVLRQRLHQKD
jgi:hypothetical protein